MILNSREIKSDGLSFDQYVHLLNKWFEANVPDFDEEAAKTHVEQTKDFFQECYNDDLSVEDAAKEDIGHWEPQ